MLFKKKVKAALLHTGYRTGAEAAVYGHGLVQQQQQHHHPTTTPTVAGSRTACGRPRYEGRWTTPSTSPNRPPRAPRETLLAVPGSSRQRCADRTPSRAAPARAPGRLHTRSQVAVWAALSRRGDCRDRKASRRDRPEAWLEVGETKGWRRPGSSARGPSPAFVRTCNSPSLRSPGLDPGSGRRSPTLPLARVLSSCGDPPGQGS